MQIAGATDALAVFIATGFGVGLLPLAPGTWGSLVGVAISYGLVSLPRYGGDNYTVYFILTSLLLSALGIWAGNRAEKIFAQKDASQVVIDEVAGTVLSFVLIAASLGDDLSRGAAWHGWFIAGFALFRLFDIFKPYPIDQLQDLPGGLGVMLDDIFAGFYAAIVLCLAMFVSAFSSG